MVRFVFMSISYRILTSRQLILVKNHGVLYRHDIFNYIAELSKDPAFNTGMDEIVSLTEVSDYNLSFNDICELTNVELENHSLLKNLHRTAFIANDPHILGKLTIYKQLSGLNQEGVGIFQRLTEACDWLEHKYADIQKEYNNAEAKWVTIQESTVCK